MTVMKPVNISQKDVRIHLTPQEIKDLKAGETVRRSPRDKAGNEWILTINMEHLNKWPK